MKKGIYLKEVTLSNGEKKNIKRTYFAGNEEWSYGGMSSESEGGIIRYLESQLSMEDKQNYLLNN